MSIPTSLKEAIVAITELQTQAEWLQGQSNLLLGFVVASPQNLQAFANFATVVATGTTPTDQAMRAVAQRLLSDGLAAHASHPGPGSPTGGKPPGGESNVIQFPSKP